MDAEYGRLKTNQDFNQQKTTLCRSKTNAMQVVLLRLDQVNHAFAHFLLE